jgi:hypothetical protein
MDNYKLILTTGAPGSAWSMVSHRFKKNFREFDMSDETPDRHYKLPDDHKSQYDIQGNYWGGRTHIGSYFGPHHEFGHYFDDLSHYNNKVSDFYQECLKPFSNNNAPWKLVKSHWFAYNLDWIWDNCKGHDLFLIWRDPVVSRDWWYQMGGWDIKHPVYDWYEGPERLWNQIQEETRLIEEFAAKKGITWYDYDMKDTWLSKHFGLSKIREVSASPKFKDTIKVAYLKIE